MPKPLKQHRRIAYMTVRDLAKEADVSPVTIWRIENAKYERLHPSTMKKIAVALKLEPAEISEFVLWEIDQQQS